MQSRLVPPHGGELVNLIAAPERVAELQAISKSWPSWDLTARQLCDLELLLTGGFSPLRGFMTRADYESTCSNMRLADGRLWPIPIVLDVTEEFAKSMGRGSAIALRDPEGTMLSALHVDEVWQPDRRAEVEAVYLTTNTQHPGMEYVLRKTNPWYVGGRLEGVQLPAHYDFRSLRLTPSELRAEFIRLGWRRIVAFQTRNPMHRAQQELTLRAAKKEGANLLIHPSVGMTKPGDVEYYVRVRCYQALLSKYPKDTVKLSLLPLAMRMGGPREALWHAIIRKNHGCSHFIVGRDHAGPGADSSGKPFYGPYDAQELLRKHQKELGVTMVPFQMLVYLEDQDAYVPEDEVPPRLTCPQHFRNGTPAASRRRAGDTFLVHFSGSPARITTQLSASAPPGLHGVLHGPLWFREVHPCKRLACQIPGNGRTTGNSTGRRHRPQAPVVRAGILTRAP